MVGLKVRATKFITLALACLLGIGLLPTFGLVGSTTDPSVLIIYPSDDAFVSSMFPDNTSVRVEDYVDIWDLWVGREWISAIPEVRVNRAFLKFDLNSMIPDGAVITSVRLRLYRVGLALQTETTGAPMVQCYAAGDDWGENTITWDNTQPSEDNEYLGSYEDVALWNSWDVTSFVQGEFEGDKLASFMLRAENEQTPETSCAIFPSKEYDDYHPHLEITYVLLQYESISPSDDVHVTQRHLDTNYGDKTSLQLRRRAEDLKNERIFLKFDLSTLPEGSTILEARLYLYAWWGSFDLVAQFRSVKDDTWREDTITWNNKPAYGGVLDTVALTREARDTWRYWDVTPFVQSEFDEDKVASFCLRAEVESEKAWYRFRSKEYDDATVRPYLEVIYSIS